MVPLATGCVERTLLFECESPDRAYVAVYYLVSGGGAAGVNEYYLSIHSRNSRKKWKVLHMKLYGVRLTWVTSTQLRVEYRQQQPEGGAGHLRGKIFSSRNRFGEDGEIELIPVPSSELDFYSTDLAKCIREN